MPTTEADIIDVVAGIIFDPERRYVLLSKRAPDAHQGGVWEFPGGKIDDGETPVQALARELVEELGIEPIQAQPFELVEHDYGDKQVRIHFMRVGSYDGSPIGRENQAIGWFPITNLKQLRFPEANTPVVDRLVQGLSHRR